MDPNPSIIYKVLDVCYDKMFLTNAYLGNIIVSIAGHSGRAV
jgi:hypothetical protein